MPAIARRILPLAVALTLLVGACSGSGDTTTTTSQPPAETSVTTTEPPAETTTTTPTTIPAEPEAEIWAGDIAGQVVEFQMIVDDAGTVSGLVGSPTEEAPEVPIGGAVIDGAVTITIPAAAARFEGEVSGDTMTGTWYQSGAEVPAIFERQTEPTILARPQEPTPPFPYDATDVRFDNGDISLAGTLVVPVGDGPFPAVVLTSGSGSQDRDETIVGHKPFLVLSDALALAGIASLRFDDRGVGGSTGDPTGATTADLATDSRAAARYLAEDGRFDSIGIVGHSEGGLIGPMVANDTGIIDYAVLLAGPGLPGLDVLLRQTEDLMRVDGSGEADIAWQQEWRRAVMEVSASDLSTEDAAAEIEAVVSTALSNPPSDITEPLDPSMTDQFVAAFTDPWMRYFLAYDPAPALKALDIPVLALIGNLDIQVSAEENIPALESALAGNVDATVSELEGLNHLFQTAETGSVSEYARIEETFSPAAMDLITGWILENW